MAALSALESRLGTLPWYQMAAKTPFLPAVLSAVSPDVKSHLITPIKVGEPRGFFSGKHGTSLGRVFKQIEKGELEDRGLSFYFDGVETAHEYALKQIWQDRDSWSMRWPVRRISDDLAVVLGVSSDTKPEKNDTEANPGLFDFHYFPPGAKVYIDCAYLIHECVTLKGVVQPGSLFYTSLDELKHIAPRSPVLNFFLRGIGVIRY